MRLDASAAINACAEPRTSSRVSADAAAGPTSSRESGVHGTGGRPTDWRATSSQTQLRSATTSGSDGGVRSLPANDCAVARASRSRRIGNHGTASDAIASETSAVATSSSRYVKISVAAAAIAPSACAASG